MKTKIAFFILVVALISSCGSDYNFDSTSDGYDITIDWRGKKILYMKDKTLYGEDAVQEVRRQIDKIVNECNATSRFNIREAALNTDIVIRDDYVFRCGAQMCSGLYSPSDGRTWVVLYDLYRGNEYPSHNFDPRLVRTGKQMAELAENDRWLKWNYYSTNVGLKSSEFPDGKLLPALCHELHHYFVLGHDGTFKTTGTILKTVLEP